MSAPTIQTSPVNMEERANLGIAPGDTVRVWIKVQERGKTHLQPFEGLVLAHKHGTEAGATFTVRKVASGVGVEKIFPLYSPAIDRIEIIRRAKVRRSKLYYIREKAARQIRRQMRNMKFVNISTESDIGQKEAAEKAAQEAEEAVQKGEEEKKAAETAANEEAKAQEEASVGDTPETEEPSTDESGEEEKGEASSEEENADEEKK